jgi:NADPH:quinone reductase
MTCIVMNDYGGPEVLQWSERLARLPEAGQVLVDIVAAGVNFMDVGVRKGQYRPSPPPLVPGVEGMGRVAALGAGVTEFKVGDRVAWFYVQGSYAQQLIAQASSLVPVPDAIPDQIAAALMMQGLTAHHFVTETYAIKPGDTAFVHSAAGGVGLLLTQMVKLLGGKVIGRVSSQDKVAIVKAAGADHVIIAADGHFAEQVTELTGGRGVEVVYDGVGADTFYESLASLRHHGVMAYYGQTIKALPPIDLFTLPKSVLVTYPTVGDHVLSREALLAHSAELFKWVEEGKLHVHIGHTYPLSDAAQAHSDIESRRTTGKLLLLP